MAAYIDLNSVRAGILEEPKEYRFSGYAEAVAGHVAARKGFSMVWAVHADGSARSQYSLAAALQAHRALIFGKRAAEAGLPEMSRKKALKVLENEDGVLPKATVLRRRMRYFTDGATLGSKEFVRATWEPGNWRKGENTPPNVNPLRRADW